MSRGLLSSAAVAALLLTTSHAFAAKSADDFIKDAIQGDNSEIMLGQVAEQKGATDQMRDFGKMLVTDHSKAKDQAVAVAKQIGVTPPDQPTTEAQDEKTKLSNLSGNAFDKEFAGFMVKAHEQTIKEFQDQAEAKQGPTSDLAAKQLPTLQEHLRMAKAAENENAAPPAVANAPTQEATDQWRASKLAGVPIYGPDDKKVGNITDVLMSKDGKAEFIVVGVGGFLGIGKKDVAIPYDEVKFTDQPITPPAAKMPPPNSMSGGMGTTSGGLGATGAMGATGVAPMGGTAVATPNAMAAKRSGAYPDHGVIDMTAAQLKNAPSFHFST